jgi:PAS domain S-box-containing protein
MKSSLERKILVFAFLVLTLTILVNTGLNIEVFRRDYRDSIVLRCQSLAAGLKGAVEGVLALGLPLAGIEGIDGQCQQLVANDPEIVYCLIEDSTGTPLYSSDPAMTHLAGSQFVSALNSSTALLVNQQGVRYFDVTIPINYIDGRLAGRIRIGFPETALDQRAELVFRRSLLLLGGALLVVFSLVVLFTKRDLVRPIQRLSAVAKEIAGGQFRVAIPSLSTNDFAELGGALGEMARSLQERDVKLRQNYRELEQTNQNLQDSYENLERIGVELRRSREMYRSLLENASDAIVVSDNEDHLVLLNKAAESFFGLPRKRVEGRNIFSFLAQIKVDDLDGQYGLHQRVLRGESLETEISFERPGDHRRLVGWGKFSPVVGKDGTPMVQAIYRDVTLERETKDNLEKSTRELQRLNQMKDSFLGVASHELKTPLTVIVGYTDLLLSEMEGKLDKAVVPLIQYIADAGERLSNIVRDMVDVSMLDSRRLLLRYRETDINSLIETVARECDFPLSRRHQTLSVDLAPNLEKVLCDPERLRQALANIIGNAIKFTPDGGRITVSSRALTSLRQPHAVPSTTAAPLRYIGTTFQPYVEIVVRDTGIGIAAAEQMHIFEKFYEVGKIEEHSTGKVAFKSRGTGLGLTIVRGIIEMHGGEIWVESPGHDPEKCPGSAFHILLPVQPVQAEESDRSE